LEPGDAGHLVGFETDPVRACRQRIVHEPGLQDPAHLGDGDLIGVADVQGEIGRGDRQTRADDHVAGLSLRQILAQRSDHGDAQSGG